jgi:hypothetical protein
MDLIIAHHQPERLIETGGKPFPNQLIEGVIDSIHKPYIPHDCAHGNPTVGENAHTSDSHGCLKGI